MKENYNRNFCVAPMMGYTTPYARKLYRILSKKTFLFTEMIASKSLIYSKNRDTIICNDNNNPVALQVGGSEIEDLRKCSQIAYEYNYNEINLNVGCPSKAVQKGAFGACLMKNKKLVRECLESMQNDKIIVSMKCRIGLGEKLNYEFFEEFVEEVIKSGIKIIYVHARNAILNGISPKANRSIPPLNYDYVSRIRTKFPEIKFVLNGGIDDINKAKFLNKNFDGVMLGRLILNNPFILSKVDNLFYSKESVNIIKEEIILKYFDYIRPKAGEESIFRLLSPILQIFFGMPNSKKYKSEIHNKIKEENMGLIQDLFLKFINEIENRTAVN